MISSLTRSEVVLCHTGCVVRFRFEMGARRVFLAAAVLGCHAADYYISSSNPRSSDSNAGTDPESPWRTLQHASSSAQLGPGDTINLLWGDVFMLHGNDTWFFTGLRGTSALPVTFRAYSDSSAPPPVRPLLLKAPGGWGSVMTLDNSSGIRMQDLQLSGGDHGLIVTLDVDAPSGETVYSGFHLVDLAFSHIRGLTPSTGSGWWGAAVAFAAKHAGVVATDVLLQAISVSDSDTVFINSIAVPGYTRVYMSGLTLTACSFTRIGYNSVFLDTLNETTIQGNVFYKDTPPYLFYAGTTDIILGSTDSSVALIGNEIGWRGEFEPGGPDGCAIDFETSAQGTVVAGNYIHDSYGAGIMVLGHSTTSQHLLIVNNTMLANGCGQALGDHGGIAFLQPNSSGIITGNVFTPCPGNSPPIFAPRNASFLADWTITGNVIDGSNGTVLVLPALDLTWIAFNGTFIVTVLDCTACPQGSTIVYSTAGRPSLSSPSTHPWPRDGTTGKLQPLILPPTGRGLWAKVMPPPVQQWEAGVTVVEGPVVGDVLVWPRG